MNIADILVIVITGIFTVMGIKSGFVKTAIKFGSLFLSLFIAFVAYPLFSDMIISSEMAQSLSEKVNTEYVLPYMNDFISKSVSENLPEESGIFGMVSENINLQAQNSAEVIANNITALFINVVVFLIILIVCRIAFAFLAKLLLSISKIPVIRQINMLAGGALGFLQGFIICLLIISVITILAPVNSEVLALDEKIQDSKIAVHIYNNNIILNNISANEN